MFSILVERLAALFKNPTQHNLFLDLSDFRKKEDCIEIFPNSDYVIKGTRDFIALLYDYNLTFMVELNPLGIPVLTIY